MTVMGTYLAIGMVALGLGVILAVPAFLPAGHSAFQSFSPSDNEFVAAKTPIIWHGRISITYYQYENRTIDLYILTESQYEKYLGGSSDDFLFTTSGSHGSVVVDLPKMGKYYLIVRCEGGSAVSVNYDLDGVIVVQAILGMTTILAGSAFLGLAWRVRGSRGVALLRPRPSDLGNPYGWVSFKWPGKEK